ncbi:proteasome regulatory particle base subunit rpn10 [Aspergillus melleus]|uniref:Proteasome regulatory particle base subunit rpn10 n=1 Tax=Aspergillus melleus TaxID=138277 RepID=A0ACC3AXT0_9EURO|nr:proteasome regulatory particle base subunit rpn10 [Aspergillus melleus]KAH8429673.1 proteasome regulatory particle base subunit rpn10 [Aspergillus melleus]KAK1142773.1 proteasome regulatory particle base subunit rpn10 [Aspergillus melleus]
MSLEATMIIVDNSESSRNGDYTSTRWQAQIDAVSVIHTAKMRVHPQSAVGLMSMGGKGPEVLSTFTTDFGGILSGLHRTKIHGTAHLSSSIQVAGLALKHRSEKSQRQRIIVFSCSPIEEDEKTLVKLAKKMKKNNVSIDVIAFGDLESDQTKKLEAFVENVKGGDGSHLAIIPPGPNLLSEELQVTPILGADNAGAEGAAGEGGDAGGFGFEDAAENDPELAFALRLSLEEEKNRQEKEKKEREEQERKENLDNIPEEGQSGESSGKDKKEDGDKMDTA